MGFLCRNLGKEILKDPWMLVKLWTRIVRLLQIFVVQCFGTLGWAVFKGFWPVTETELVSMLVIVVWLELGVAQSIPPSV